MDILPRLYNEKEIKFHRLQFQETLRVYGIGVKYHAVHRDDTERVLDFYNDITSKSIAYRDPINIRVLFETNPTPRTLKALGWYVNDDELPYLVYIPTVYKDENNTAFEIIPNVDDKFEFIENIIDHELHGRSKREYIIKDMKSQGYPDTIYYIAKIVPVYDSQKDGLDLYGE